MQRYFKKSSDQIEDLERAKIFGTNPHKSVSANMILAKKNENWTLDCREIAFRKLKITILKILNLLCRRSQSYYNLCNDAKSNICVISTFGNQFLDNLRSKFHVVFARIIIFSQCYNLVNAFLEISLHRIEIDRHMAIAAKHRFSKKTILTKMGRKKKIVSSNYELSSRLHHLNRTSWATFIRHFGAF